MSLFRADIADPFSQMERRMGSLFRDFMSDYNQLTPSASAFGTQPAAGPITWSPRSDLFEDDSSYVLRVELPGVKKEHVKVDARSDSIHVWAEKKSDEKLTPSALYQERRYGRYERVYPLMRGTKSDQCSAKFENGVLEVKVPKAQQREGIKSITVQ